MLGPVEVLSGVPFGEAERASALLRDAGIPVSTRRVVEGRWLYVAPADEAQALRILAAHGFPGPMPPMAGSAAVKRGARTAAPGDDVWALLTEPDPPYPSVYAFPSTAAREEAPVRRYGWVGGVSQE
ncbi:MAG: hypothetical protein WCS72_04430 [Deltaproteobacteria bacterium]